MSYSEAVKKLVKKTGADAIYYCVIVKRNHIDLYVFQLRFSSDSASNVR